MKRKHTIVTLVIAAFAVGPAFAQEPTMEPVEATIVDQEGVQIPAAIQTVAPPAMPPQEQQPAPIPPPTEAVPAAVPPPSVPPPPPVPVPVAPDPVAPATASAEPSSATSVPSLPPESMPGAASASGEPTPPPPPATVGGVKAEGGSLAATWVKGMPLNDLFAVLSRKIGYQYFSNPSLVDFKVDGQLYDEVGTIEQIRDIAMQYGVTIYARGNTLYALTNEQLVNLPRTEWTYKLKYLNIHSKEERESLDSILRPAISERGSINFEPMTRTVVVMDNEHSVRSVASLLEKIDKPQKQVIVKVQILRLLNNAGSQIGVDWQNSLGDGINVGVTAFGPLSDIFNSTPLVGGYGQLADIAGDAVRDAIFDGTGGPSASNEYLPAPASPLSQPTGLAARAYQSGALPAGIVLNPLEISAVIRALIEKDQAVQESGPTVIIKDNQAGSFSIVELIPIVTSTATQSDGVTLITSQVSYQIDPERGTYVGLQVGLRPSVLPDNTIEMLLEPRIATVTGFTVAETGIEGVANRYPNVNETSVDSIARIPDGYSLVLSGYYQIEERERDNKVPLLGDIPGLSFAFRSKTREKVRSNILFILTPTTYDPVNAHKTVEVSEMVRQNVRPPRSIDYPDNEMPGEDTSPNFAQRIRNMLPFNPNKNRSKEDPHHPVQAKPRPEIVTEQQLNQRKIEQRLRNTGTKEDVIQTQ